MKEQTGLIIANLTLLAICLLSACTSGVRSADRKLVMSTPTLGPTSTVFDPTPVQYWPNLTRSTFDELAQMLEDRDRFLRPHSLDNDPIFRAATLVIRISLGSDNYYGTAALVKHQGKVGILTVSHVVRPPISNQSVRLEVVIPGDGMVSFPLSGPGKILVENKAESYDWDAVVFLPLPPQMEPLIKSGALKPLTLAGQRPSVNDEIHYFSRVPTDLSRKTGRFTGFVSAVSPINPNGQKNELWVFLSHPLCNGNSGTPIFNSRGEVIGSFVRFIPPVYTPVAGSGCSQFVGIISVVPLD